MSKIFIVCMIVVDVMMLNSMFCFVLNVVEQLIVLMLDLVFQGSALVIGHVVIVKVTVVFVISRDNLITGKVMCPRLLFLLVAGGLFNFVHLLTPVATMRLRVAVVFLLLM